MGKLLTDKLRCEIWKQHLRGATNVKIAERLGLTGAHVGSVINAEMEALRERAKVRESTATLVERKLKQYEDMRDEAWQAWLRSAEDGEVTTTEKQLRTVYKESTQDGRTVRLPAGERLKVVKEIRRVQGRLAGNEYLVTILRCLQEEAKLEGISQEAVTNITNINAAVAGVAFSWEQLSGRPRVRDPIERLIEEAESPPPPLPADLISPQEPTNSPLDSYLDVGKVLTVGEQPVGQWSEAEAAELSDENPPDSDSPG